MGVDKILRDAVKVLVVGVWISRSKWDYGMWRKFRVYALTKDYQLIEITPSSVGLKGDVWECSAIGTDRILEVVKTIARQTGIPSQELERKTVFLSRMP